MRALITGGAGFVGSHLGRRLLGEGAETVAVFVVSGRPGDDAASCAESWGADEIVWWDAD